MQIEELLEKIETNPDNLRNVKQLYSNGTIRIKDWNKYAKLGASLVYVEKLDEISYKVSFIDKTTKDRIIAMKNELIGDKITE